MEKIFTVIVVVTVFAVIYAFSLYIIPLFIDEFFFKRRSRNNVGKIIAVTHSKTPLTKKQIEIMAADHYLTARDIQILLRRQFSEAVKNGDHLLIEYFQNLYEELERDEPFEGLPADIRLHLERIKEAIGKDREFLMSPLVSQLQDINTTNRRKEKWMWGLTITSVIAGIIGVIFGAIPYLTTNTPVAVPQKNNSHTETTTPSAIVEKTTLSIK
jgi:predicted PurR-regulated permease PerM